MMSYNRSGSSYKKKTTFKRYERKAPKIIQPSIPRSERVWSPLQMNIFSFISGCNENALVLARAGSGKTTTLEEVVRRIHETNPKLNIGVVAFSSDIKNEVAGRLHDITTSGKVEVMTSHSLGYRFCRAEFRCGQPDAYKMDRIIESLIGPESEELGYALKDCISKVKLTCTETTPEAIDALMDNFGIDLGKGETESERADFVRTVQKALGLSRAQTGIIDFDDMLDIALTHNIISPIFDVILVDEYQDFNRAQLNNIIAALKTGGRIIAFGDDKQAIFRFMGADETSIPTFIKTLKATTLKLTWTYRCAKSIVRLANEVVPDLEAPANADEGKVGDIEYADALGCMRPGDFVLSRTNAPLVKICMRLLHNGIPATILGGDLSRSLLWTVKKSQAKTVSDLVRYIEDWRSSEKDRLASKNRNSSWVDERADCIIAFATNASDVNDVKQNIKRMFNDTDDTKRVTLSSVHKAKGLERDRVFMLNDTFKRGESTEEDNIWYVCITRAKKELFRVSGLQ